MFVQVDKIGSWNHDRFWNWRDLLTVRGKGYRLNGK